MESLIDLISEIFESFRIVDVIDILLVSVFLYAVLVWFQRAASRGMVFGVVVLSVVYFMARGLDMYLTSLAFHTSFAVLVLILVVVFQEDLRRLLESVSSLRSVRFRMDDAIKLDLDMLVETIFKLAASHTGALIVLRGKEPLERHLNGGVAVNGQISRSLLCSIFDPHSPGHDGAVVIERDRITEFAAHLPISKNTKVIAGRGTRHSAALGLSENSDALTIVVSEERGVVSVAEGGQLEETASPSELRRRLESLSMDVVSAASQSVWQRFVLQHSGLKALSFAIALLAWLLFAYDPNTVQRTFVAPIEYRNLAKGVELDATAPTEARITLTGSDRDFRFLDPGSLKIAIDLADKKPGRQEIPIVRSNLKLPGNVEIYRIEPRIIKLLLRGGSTGMRSSGYLR